MNLLVESPSDFIKVGGSKLKMKTDFVIWVRFLIAIEGDSGETALRVLNDIFGEIPPDLDVSELTAAIMDWLYQARERVKIETNGRAASKAAFDFSVDGNVIFCELWEYFPHLMERGISFQAGLELIKLLISNENTMMHHRAFARCGDFSKLGKEHKQYWLGERAKYAICAKQEDVDAVLSHAF